MTSRVSSVCLEQIADPMLLLQGVTDDRGIHVEIVQIVVPTFDAFTAFSDIENPFQGRQRLKSSCNQ